MKFQVKIFLVNFGTLILLLFIFSPQTYADYSITELRSLGNSNNLTSATKINNNGQIIGRCTLTSSQKNFACLWDNGNIKPIINFGSDMDGVTATDINDQGQIVGSITKSNSNGFQQIPFLWKKGKYTDLSSLFPQNSRPTPAAINNNGQIVGSFCINPNCQTHAFLINHGTLTDLGSFSGDYSSATDINDNGQIVGTYGWISKGRAHGFIWQNGTMIDLEDVNSTDNVQVAGINNSGQIAGSRQINSATDWQAFRWDSGVFTNLGDLNNVTPNPHYSLAKGINDNGEIVGESNYVDQSGVAYLRAFLWKNGNIINLGSLVQGSSSYSSATNINNNEKIVGYNWGYYNNDSSQFFLKALLWQ